VSDGDRSKNLSEEMRPGRLGGECWGKGKGNVRMGEGSPSQTRGKFRQWGEFESWGEKRNKLTNEGGTKDNGHFRAAGQLDDFWEKRRKGGEAWGLCRGNRWLKNGGGCNASTMLAQKKRKLKKEREKTRMTNEQSNGFQRH